MRPTVRDTVPNIDKGGAVEPRIDAFLISADDSLLLELGPALGDRFRTRPIEHPGDLPAESQAPWIGFVDGTRGDAQWVIEQIGLSHPQAALIAIAADADLRNWLGPVFRGSVCAVIGTRQIGTAALTAALSSAQQRLRQPPPRTGAIQAPVLVARRPTAADARPARKIQPGWLMAALLCTALLTVALFWRLLASRERPAATGIETSAEATPAVVNAQPACRDRSCTPAPELR